MKVQVPSAFLVSVAYTCGGDVKPPLPSGVNTVVAPFSWRTWTSPLKLSTARDMVYPEVHPNPNGEFTPAWAEL